MRLPVIVSMGGVNAAGRTSGYQSYRRMVIDALSVDEKQSTLTSLAVMMGLVKPVEGGFEAKSDTSEVTLSAEDVAAKFETDVLDGTLVRRVEKERFDVDELHWQSAATLAANSDSDTSQFTFSMAKKDVPRLVPDKWHVEKTSDDYVNITVDGGLDVLLSNAREFPVKAAGQLPRGFDPSGLYNSRFQPRGLQLALFGATDALRSLGIPWETVLEAIGPDEVGVYSSSGFGQMDAEGYGGMHQARMTGQRVTAKSLVMGINSMPTDFINAYVLSNVGIASSSVAACATFLSNLRHAVSDIQAGKVRVAMVGNSEAPVQPELMDGFATMGALATDDNMTKVYGEGPHDYRRASRPFGENCGFTIGESSQYFMLMDDELAMTLGAPCLGSITDVFIDADGTKKSITAPGPGNHITMAKAVAAATALVGAEAVQNKSFVMAHGSSTPQNRVTESQIFDQVATVFGITDWPIAAVKAYLGHTIAPASGDQLTTALGSFAHGIIPGVPTIDRVADDVHQDRLKLGPDHQSFQSDDLRVAFLNSKGFGGNNATAVVLSPKQTEDMLGKRYGDASLSDYKERRKRAMDMSSDYIAQADLGEYAPIYRFGEPVISEKDVHISSEHVSIQGMANDIKLPLKSPYGDMT